MSNTLKNLLIILALLTVGYGAYYLYTVRESTSSTQDISDLEFEAMLARTEQFIERRRELDRMQIDVGIFADTRFTNLEANETPLQEVEAGRSNPFAEVNGN